MATATSCSCGCSSMTSVTAAAEPCGCGCECCGKKHKSKKEEILELQNLRTAIDSRLAELSSPVSG